MGKISTNVIKSQLPRGSFRRRMCDQKLRKPRIPFQCGMPGGKENKMEGSYGKKTFGGVYVGESAVWKPRNLPPLPAGRHRRGPAACKKKRKRKTEKTESLRIRRNSEKLRLKKGICRLVSRRWTNPNRDYRFKTGIAFSNRKEKIE